MTHLDTVKIWHWLRRHVWLAVALIIVGIGIAVFSELADELREGGLGYFDQSINHVVAAYRTPLLFWLAYGLSQVLAFPYVGIWVAAVAVLLWVQRCRLLAIAFATIPLATGLIVEGLKAIFRRHRPLDAVVYALGNSFPSGHAAGSLVTYGLLAYIAWRCWVRNQWGRALLVALAALLTLATGLARIYLQVHYPSDVVGGWAAGACILAGSIIVLERLSPSDPNDTVTAV